MHIYTGHVIDGKCLWPAMSTQRMCTQRVHHSHVSDWDAELFSQLMLVLGQVLDAAILVDD